MAEDRQVDQEVLKKIKETFNLEKLCPKCGGPLEWDREIHCEKCALVGDVKQLLVFIELGVMRLRNRVGLSSKQLNELTKKKNFNDFITGGDPDDEIPDYKL